MKLKTTSNAAMSHNNTLKTLNENYPKGLNGLTNFGKNLKHTVLAFTFLLKNGLFQIFSEINWAGRLEFGRIGQLEYIRAGRLGFIRAGHMKFIRAGRMKFIRAGHMKFIRAGRMKFIQAGHSPAPTGSQPLTPNPTPSSLFPLFSLILIVLISASNTLSAQSIFPSFGSARSGTAGFQFTKVDIDPRNTAMGHSAMADLTGGGSLVWNPALAVQTEGSEVYGSHTSYFADIGMEYLGAIYNTGSVAFGLSMQYMNSGEMNETTAFNPFGTGRTFQTAHINVGLTASQKLTNLFSYGITLKYLQEDLEAVRNSTAAIDLGFFYKVGDTGLSFAVGLNSFGFDSSPSGETTRQGLDGEITEDLFEDITLPTTFNMAAAYELIKGEEQGLILTGQIQNPSDNAERMSFGAEYRFRQQLFFRSGYRFGVDEANWPTFGIGLNIPVMGKDIRFDYAFAGLERLGQTHRIAFSVGL